MMRLESPWLTHLWRARWGEGVRGEAPGASMADIAAPSLQSRTPGDERRVVNVLLLRPDPGNERFGLGPFFRIEPLGLEYLASALIARGQGPAILDLRFGRRLRSQIRRTRPKVVGISATAEPLPEIPTDAIRAS